MALDIVIGERPAAVLARHLRGPLPARALGQVDHPPEQPPVGPHAEDGRRDDPVEVRVGVGVLQQDHVLGRLGVRVAQVGLDPRLPVGMPHRRGAARDHELARHEVVVGDGVGREVAEIPQPERAQRIGGGEVVDLLADVPVVAVATERRVVLRDRGVGGDVAVEEVEGVGAEQIGHGGRQLGQAGRGPTRPDRCACPGVQAWAECGKRESDEPHAREGEREARQGHDRPAASMRRTRPSMPLPRRTERSVDATSSAASSTSPCTTS